MESGVSERELTEALAAAKAPTPREAGDDAEAAATVAGIAESQTPARASSSNWSEPASDDEPGEMDTFLADASNANSSRHSVSRSRPAASAGSSRAAPLDAEKNVYGSQQKLMEAESTKLLIEIRKLRLECDKLKSEKTMIDTRNGNLMLKRQLLQHRLTQLGFVVPT